VAPGVGAEVSSPRWTAGSECSAGSACDQWPGVTHWTCLAADSFSSRALASPISKQTRAEKITPLLEDPRDARLRFRLYGFSWLFVACGGAAFAVALFTGYRFDWVFGAVLLPFGVALTWRSLRDILDRRRFVLFIVRVALYGALLGAFASQYLGER
jgi:hypothetical protein